MAGVRNFGKPNADPRAKRAYAHAKLAEARTSGTIEDLLAAKKAVDDCGNNRKTQRSGFPEALTGVALAHEPTRIVATTAQHILDDPRNRKRSSKYLGNTSLRTPDYKLGHAGSVVTRVESYHEDGSLRSHGPLHIVDHSSGVLGVRPYKTVIIPTDTTGAVDVIGLRMLPDTRLAKLTEMIGPLAQIV